MNIREQQESREHEYMSPYASFSDESRGRDKNNLLDLYNGLNDTDYTNVDDLMVTTLKGGVYMK
jgi:hypothetical protein